MGTFYLHSQRSLIRIFRNTLKDLACRHQSAPPQIGQARLSTIPIGVLRNFSDDKELCGAEEK